MQRKNCNVSFLSDAFGPKLIITRYFVLFPQTIRRFFPSEKIQLSSYQELKPFEVKDISIVDNAIIQLTKKTDRLIIQFSNLGWLFYSKFGFEISVEDMLDKLNLLSKSDEISDVKSPGRYKKKIQEVGLLHADVSPRIVSLEDFHQIMGGLIYGLGGFMQGRQKPSEDTISNWLGLSKDFLRRIKEERISLLTYSGTSSAFGISEYGKVVILPGRFQPPHIGHINMIIKLMLGDSSILDNPEDSKNVFPISKIIIMIGPRESVRRGNNPLFVGERVHLFRRLVQKHPFLRTLSHRIYIGVSPGSEDELWVAKMLRELGEQRIDAIVSGNTQTLQHVQDIRNLMDYKEIRGAKPVLLRQERPSVLADQTKWLQEVRAKESGKKEGDHIAAYQWIKGKEGDELKYVEVEVSGRCFRKAIEKGDETYLKNSLPNIIYSEVEKQGLFKIMKNIITAR